MKTLDQPKTKTKNPFKKIPWWGWVGAVIFLGLQFGLYKLGGIFGQMIGQFWKFCPKIPVIDDGIPFCPYFFIEIYILSYVFWFVGPLWISTSHNKQNFINFMIYSVIAFFIGFFLFFLIPTYLDRQAEGVIAAAANIKTPITKFIMQCIIQLDSGDIGWNLCPSYHCMCSALCAFGVLCRKEHKIATQIGFSVMAVLIFASTVLVKQHYFIDIIGGVAIAVVPYLFVVYLWKPGEKIMSKKPLFLEIKRKNKQQN